MRLLVVEDSPDLGVLLESWLEGVAEVRVRVEAAEVTDDDIDWAECVLADQMLPDVTGCELLARVAQRRPGLRRVMWTAAAGTVCPYAHQVAVKPVSGDVLHRLLEPTWRP